MVGSALRKKLLRDVAGMWGQFAAATAVVLLATMVFVTFRVTYNSLIQCRDAYYRENRFADFFVNLERAPRSALRDVEAIPGVWRVQGRIVKEVPLEVPGNEGSVVGRIVSMPERRERLINDIHMVRGSYFPGTSLKEVIVNPRFCKANGLQVGDTFQATINERKEDLRIVGMAMSPEYVYVIRNVQQLAPDDESFGVIFAREAFVEDAFNLTNAFNDLAGLLRPGADVDRVLEGIEEELSTYGVYLKHGRFDQPSNRYLHEELKGVRAASRAVPMVFLLVAAAVIHVIVRRLTELQRTQIGLLCALGYTKGQVIWHYVSYALVIGVAGTVLGAVLSRWAAGLFLIMYRKFFTFPSLTVRFQASPVFFALALNCGVCIVGAGRSAWRVLKMEPAVALAPKPAEEQPIVHVGVLAALWQRLPLTWRIAVRNTFRNRARTLFSAGGVAVAMMILVVGRTTNDFVDFIIEHHFGKVELADVRVEFVNERPESAAYDVRHVDGVRRVEGIYQIGADLRKAWRTKFVAILGLPRENRLYRVLDRSGARTRVPPQGLIVPRMLADRLDLRPGDTVGLDPFVEDLDERDAVVRGVVDEYMGMNVYADRKHLARLLGKGPMLTGAMATVERRRLKQVMDSLDDLPGVRAVTATGQTLESFMESVEELIGVAVLVQTIAGAVIAFAVIYNASSVSIAEQERDLACMHSLGYSRRQVADIATHEVMPLGLIGVILGVPLAILVSHIIADAFETDLYRLPMVVRPVTYLTCAVLVLCFLFISRWLVRRRVYRIDIVRRLKTRE